MITEIEEVKQQVKNDTFQEEDDQQSEEEQQAVTTIQGPVEPKVNPEPEDPIPPTYHETPDDDDDYDHDYDYDQLKDEYLELLKEVKWWTTSMATKTSETNRPTKRRHIHHH